MAVDWLYGFKNYGFKIMTFPPLPTAMINTPVLRVFSCRYPEGCSEAGNRPRPCYGGMGLPWSALLSGVRSIT